jgi:pimeloyl-ACP methyl ester carboxylesterase
MGSYMVYDFDTASQANNAPLIKGFKAGDKIDLRGMDGDVLEAGQQGFDFLGKVSSQSFTSAGEQIRYRYDATSNQTQVYINNDHDRNYEARIEIQGNHTLTENDFLLPSGSAPTPTPTPTPSPTPGPIKAPLGKQTLKVDYGDATLETFTYRPPGEIKGVLLDFHGSSRNADGARNSAMKMADKYGLYVVAPKFSEAEYSNSEYQRGGMVSNGELLPKDDWTVSLVDDIALWAHEQVGSDRTDETIAFGHSAGGQFASRVAAFGPDIFDKIIVTNPSTHVRASLTEDMPYGFDGYMSSAEEEAYLKDYLADPVTIYLGSDDNDPNAADLSMTAGAMRQGDHRLERGNFVYNEAKQLAESKGWDFNWELVIADDVGHTASGMFNAPEFQEAFDGRHVGSSIDWFA